MLLTRKGPTATSLFQKEPIGGRKEKRRNKSNYKGIEVKYIRSLERLATWGREGKKKTKRRGVFVWW